VSQFKKYHPSGNLKLNYLGIFHGLKLRTLMGKILPMDDSGKVLWQRRMRVRSMRR